MAKISTVCRWLAVAAAVAVWFCQSIIPAWAAFADERIEFTADIPYYLGEHSAPVAAGEVFQSRLALLYKLQPEQAAEVKVILPPEITAVNVPPEWRGQDDGAAALILERRFSDGYEQWFDMLQFKVSPEAAAGVYQLIVEVRIDESVYREVYKVPVEAAGGGLAAGELSVENVIVPFDRDSGRDQRLANGTLTLRDEVWDYYKNLLKGKGAGKSGLDKSHPLTNMAVEIVNPRRESKLVVVKTALLDKATGQIAPGLISPDSDDGEENQQNLGLVTAEPHTLTAFMALNGAARQTVDLPVYVDESVLSGGEYVLRVSVEDNGQVLTAYTMPIKIVARDYRAAVTTALASLLVLCGLPLMIRQRVLRQLKTRWLITAGLFGATAFAAVNVPSNFITDFCNIILGPFSFIVSGMFSGVLLYMLIAALVVLIPRRGVVTLMLMVRMLINMLVFGHISPVSILFYGAQALLLETGFSLCALTGGDVRSTGRKQFVMMAAACGIADAASTFINLQALSFLYRLYYADWYILLCVAISGFVYPMIGSGCGVLLGRELRKVGVD